MHILVSASSSVWTVSNSMKQQKQGKWLLMTDHKMYFHVVTMNYTTIYTGRRVCVCVRLKHPPSLRPGGCCCDTPQHRHLVDLSGNTIHLCWRARCAEKNAAYFKEIFTIQWTLPQHLCGHVQSRMGPGLFYHVHKKATKYLKVSWVRVQLS